MAVGAARCRAGVAAAALLLSVAAAGAGQAQPSPPAADAVLTRSLTAAERHFGPQARQLLPILARLARLRFTQAALPQATSLRRRALGIALAAYGATSLPAAQAMAALAHVYIEQRRYLDAEPLVIAATNILRGAAKPPRPAMAALFADRAQIALARGELEEAAKWAQAAVATDQQSRGIGRSERLRVLGTVLVAEDRFDEGEHALQQSLAAARAAKDNFATARSLAALARAYLRQKRFAEALPPIEEAGLIDQASLARTHPLLAEDFDTLGLVYLGLGRPGDAAAALRTGLGLLDRGAGRDTPTEAYIELDLARAEQRLGREAAARSLFKAARRILNAAEDEERARQRRI
jgi:tetratricopeptide (TPR) repeat protein